MKPAKIVVESLINAGVKMVFGIPGAKIDALFNELLDHPEIRLIICRHEQNAAFIAAAIGRLTGMPGVCIGTFDLFISIYYFSLNSQELYLHLKPLRSLFGY